MAKGKHHINPDTGEINACSATIKCAFATEGEIPVHYETRKDAQTALDEELKHLALPETLKRKEVNDADSSRLIGVIYDPTNDGPDPSPGFDDAGWDAWREDLNDTADGGCAWENYIDTLHTGINGVLRNDAALKALEEEGVWDREAILADVENLRNLFNYPFVPVVQHTSVVFRGVEATEYADLKYGDDFVDKGFFSTCQTDDVGLFGDFRFRIVVPVGKKFIPGNEGDNELIFAPGTKFKVGRRFRDELQLEMVLDEHDEVDFQ